MRHFRHLTKAEISDIVASHAQGETQASLARRYGIDHSTVHYHVQAYERAYPEQGGIYAVIKVDTRKTCLHPSSRCTICGEMKDELIRVERETIRTLSERLERANSLLRTEGYDVE